MAGYQLEERTFEHEVARAAAERAAFVRATTSALRHVAKPVFEAVVLRLTHDGGGGRVEERPPEGRHGLRLTLWMSLDGPIVGAPRQDHHPYVQLDLDADQPEVRVWEGDMWHGLGASRPATPLTLADLTEDVIFDRALTVLGRATAHTRRMTAVFDKEGD